MVVINLRTLISIGGEWVTDLSLLRDFNRSGDKLVVNLLVDKESAASDAALTLIEVKTNLRLGDSEVDIGVVHDDVGRLSSELKSDALQIVLVRVAHDLVSDLS